MSLQRLTNRKKRDLYVLTHTEGMDVSGYHFLNNMTVPISVWKGKDCNEEIFVIDGAWTFTQFIPYAPKLYITFTNKEVNKKAPVFDFHNWTNHWRSTGMTLHIKDIKSDSPSIIEYKIYHFKNKK